MSPWHRHSRFQAIQMTHRVLILGIFIKTIHPDNIKKLPLPWAVGGILETSEIFFIKYIYSIIYLMFQVILDKFLITSMQLFLIELMLQVVRIQNKMQCSRPGNKKKENT